jgi:O-antigen ligase
MTGELDRYDARTAIYIGVAGATVALLPDYRIQLGLVGLLAGATLLYWLLWNPSRWLVAFFFAAILLPPLPLPGGNSGLSVAPSLAAFGVVSALLSARSWRSPAHPAAAALTAFTGALTMSVAFALLYSGWKIATASLLRVCLFAISGFVFGFAYAGPRSDRWDPRRWARYLFGLAIIAAAFACADFYFQFPAPAGFGDQFIWLQGGVLRRAQGLFYEASTLGNFCAFFLVMIAVAYVRERRERIFSRPALLFGGSLLGTALVLSYSRASVVNVVVSVSVLGLLRLRRLQRAIVSFLCVLIVAAAIINVVNPELSRNYWGRLLASFSYFWAAPNKVLSGRLSNWSLLAQFINGHPWHLLMGVGYKTLPYSLFTGSPVVADNTYLGLLVETGLSGIVTFLVLNATILATGWRALRSSNADAAFFGEWIFCFWCGQVVQMFSGDLITYWRVLPVYFWVLGAAARASEER